MQNGSFQNNMYYIIELYLLLHSCVPHFNVAVGKDETNFSYCICLVACELFLFLSSSIILHHNFYVDYILYY